MRVVDELHPNGSLRVTKAGDGAVAALPADYVTEHLELGYATTAHRTQGRTVDIAHAYISATTLREPLYVMATRGRETNRLYVDTALDPDYANSHGERDPANPVDVLGATIANIEADSSATQVRRAE